MGFHVGRHHVAAFPLALAGRAQHGEGLAHPGRVTEEDLELAPVGLGFLGLGQLEHGLRRRPDVVAVVVHGLSSARLSSRTLTRGSPSRPNCRPSVWLATKPATASTERLRAKAMRGICSRAASREMWGSRPLAEASTRSAGMGVVTPRWPAGLRSVPPRWQGRPDWRGRCWSRPRPVGCRQTRRWPRAGARSSAVRRRAGR